MNIQIIALSIDLLIAIAVGIAVLRKPKGSGARAILVMALFTAIWGICDILSDRPAVSLTPACPGSGHFSQLYDCCLCAIRLYACSIQPSALDRPRPFGAPGTHAGSDTAPVLDEALA